jgi:hypothetical protein
MTMRRATVTIPDELDKELQDWLATQAAPPSLAKVLQAALRVFLREKKLEAVEYHAAAAPFAISSSRSGSGHRDVSVEHDAHIAEPS